MGSDTTRQHAPQHLRRPQHTSSPLLWVLVIFSISRYPYFRFLIWDLGGLLGSKMSRKFVGVSKVTIKNDWRFVRLASVSISCGPLAFYIGKSFSILLSNPPHRCWFPFFWLLSDFWRSRTSISGIAIISNESSIVGLGMIATLSPRSWGRVPIKKPRLCVLSYCKSIW